MLSSTAVLQQEETNSAKRTQTGITTADVVMSAFVSGNAEVFSQILSLHVPEGARVADVTWGKRRVLEECAGR